MRSQDMTIHTRIWWPHSMLGAFGFDKRIAWVRLGRCLGESLLVIAVLACLATATTGMIVLVVEAVAQAMAWGTP